MRHENQGRFSAQIRLSKTWRECIKKVWEVDPLECPNCGAEMEIVSFINDALIFKETLKHLRLWQVEHPGKPPPDNLFEEMIEYQPFDDGWDDYEEPSITLNGFFGGRL